MGRGQLLGTGPTLRSRVSGGVGQGDSQRISRAGSDRLNDGTRPIARTLTGKCGRTEIVRCCPVRLVSGILRPEVCIPLSRRGRTGRNVISRGTRPLRSVSRQKLSVTALTCLSSFVLL